jgi:hypothetical protein
MAFIFCEPGEVLEVAYDDLPADELEDPEAVSTAFEAEDYARVVDGRVPGPTGFLAHWTGHYLLSSSDCQMFVMQDPRTDADQSRAKDEAAAEKARNGALAAEVAATPKGIALTVPIFSRVCSCRQAFVFIHVSQNNALSRSFPTSSMIAYLRRW